jgi:5'-3' exonuclease
MGVPSYFNWLIQKYKTEAIIATKPTFKIENLFLDLNCAIHPAVKADPNYTIDQMYQAIIVYIDNIYHYNYL